MAHMNHMNHNAPPPAKIALLRPLQPEVGRLRYQAASELSWGCRGGYRGATGVRV